LNRDYTPPPPPPSFTTIAVLPPSTKPLELTPTGLAIAAATLELTTAVKKHQANSLSLLCVTTGTGAIMDSKMGLLRKHIVSLMLSATICMQKAGGTCFSLKALYKIARSKEKEARQLFAKEDSVISAANDTATAMSSITDPNGFTTGSCHGGASFSSPPKQQPQSCSPPHPGNKIKRVNLFDDKFLTSFPPSSGHAMDPAVTIGAAINAVDAKNDEEPGKRRSPCKIFPPFL
jgi:hypothetical protein